jgi:hypothetical protein
MFKRKYFFNKIVCGFSTILNNFPEYAEAILLFEK